MALLFIDGFDHYDDNGLLRKWTSNSTPSSSFGVSMTSGHRGDGAFFSGTNSYIQKTFPATSSWVVGFRFKFTMPSSGIRVCSFLDGNTTQVELRIYSDGTLSVTRNSTAVTGGSSTNSLASNTWYYIEFKVTIADSIAANSCKVRVNGVDWITVATGQDLKNGTNSTANVLRLGPDASPNGTHYFNDVYVSDQSGGAPHNDFLGDVVVETVYPDAAGTYQEFTQSGQQNSAHRYWRLHVSSTEGNTSADLHVYELQLRTAAGGANVASGGTASASSSQGTNTPDKAFDGSTSTSWRIASGTLPANQWLQYDFGAGNEKNIVEFAISASGLQAPLNGYLQYSDDGVSFENKAQLTTAPWGGSVETRVFSAVGPSTDHFDKVDDTAFEDETGGFYDFVQGNAAGERETFGFGALRPLASQTIYGVQVNARAVKDDAGARSASLLAKSGSTVSEGSSTALGTSSLLLTQLWVNDPDGGAAWTESSVNAAEFGIKVAA